MVVKTQEEGGGTQQSLSNRGDEVEEKEVLWRSRVTQIYGHSEGTLADIETSNMFSLNFSSSKT